MIVEEADFIVDRINLPEEMVARDYYTSWKNGCDALLGDCNCGENHVITDWEQKIPKERLKNILYVKGVLGWQHKKYNSRVILKPGTRIIFTRMMTDPPCDESPGNLYCYEGDGGVVQEAPKYTHRHLVKWDNWIHGHYAEHLKDFVIDPREYGRQLEIQF